MRTENRNGNSFILFEQLEPRLLLTATSEQVRQVAYPTGYDQYLLELLNRARANPSAEASLYGIDLNEGLAPGTISIDAKQPLAWNLNLGYAAQEHSQWMLDTDTFSHTGAGGSSAFDRMTAAGYSYSGAGENIAWNGTTGVVPQTQYTADIHENLFVDAGVDGRGHRLNIMSPGFKEVGVGVKFGDFQGWNAAMAAEDFGYRGGSSFLTGVAYDDDLVSNNDFYTPGEGLGGVTVTAVRQGDGAVFSVITWDSGGYTIQLAAGTYDVTANGGGLGGVVIYSNMVIGTQNVKRDFTPDMLAPSAPTGVSASDGTYTDKVRVTWAASSGATAYEVWRNTSDNSGTAGKINPSDVTTTSYDDTSAVVGTTYYYWVKAKNAGGTSGFSNSDSGYSSQYISRTIAPGDKMVFTDANGDLVTLSFKGTGSGVVFFASDGWSDIHHIVLNGTDARSSLSFKVKASKTGGGNGRTEVGDLEVNGPLGSVAGKGVVLKGALTSTGGIGKMALTNAEAGSSIQAAWLGSLSVAENFAGDMTLTGSGSPPKGLTLGKAKVGAFGGAAIWDVRGNAGSVSATTWQAGGILAVGAGTGADGLYFTADDEATGGLLGSVKYRYCETDNSGDDFGIIADAFAKLKLSLPFEDGDFCIVSV